MSDDKSAIDELIRASKAGVVHTVLHYLYLPSKSAAMEVAARLRAQGFTTEERRGADGVNWLVLAKHQIVPSESEMAAARQLMERLTAPLNGEYDGWEAEVVQT